MKNYLKGLVQQTKTRNQLTVAVYRLMALVIAIILIVLVVSDNDFIINPLILIVLTFAEGLVMSVAPFLFAGRNQNIALIGLLVVDIILCLLLVTFSGALNSPFILYSLSPVLTTALILNKRTTFILSVMVAGGVIISHIFNPYYPYSLSPLSISSISIYVVAVGLVGVLPFIVNANLKQRLEDDQARQERLRLSREIHDGVAQTLIALSWQFQQMRRNFMNNKAEIDELIKLEKLAQQATRDIRESIEVLRDYESKGDFVFLIRTYLENWKKENNIEYSLNTTENGARLEGKIESEALKVFQEALVNIKKHSGASHVQVDLDKIANNFQIVVADNGRGFEHTGFSNNNPRLKGHYGLNVMRERMNSIKGDLIINSQPGKGTEIKIIFPYKIKEEQYDKND